MKKWFVGQLRSLCLNVAEMCLRDGNRRGMIQWAKWAGAVRRWGTR